MFVNRRSITIEWGDCDPAGIVFYPRYFAMFDASTAELFHAALGCTKFEMFRRFDFAGFPMVDTGARFSVPSRFGDVVTIESQITRFGRSSFDVQHRLMRGSVLAIEAHEKRVWVSRDPEDPERIRSAPIPQEVIERLTRNQSQDQGNQHG
jgi:4-hydroxybenzoyl-CoA thioesterase